MIEKNVEGKEIKTFLPVRRRSRQVIDIFAALKKSLECAETGRSKKPPYHCPN